MGIKDDRRILVVSCIGCGPPFMGNRIRMRELLKQIRNLGFEIHFAGICLSEEEVQSVKPYIDVWITNFGRAQKNSLFEKIRNRAKSFLNVFLNKIKSKKNKINYKLDELFDAQWYEETIKIQNSNKFKRVLIPYVFHSKFFDAFGNSTLKILDTHDVFGNRNQMLQELGIDDFWYSTTKEEEKKGLLRADKIIAIQSHEEEYFRKLAEDKAEVGTVGHFIEPQFLPLSHAKLNHFGFIGSENPLNINGLQWFIEEVLPLIKQKFTEFKFIVGGRICQKFGESEDFELLGEFDSINDFYADCSFTINPIQAGTGLKIKTIESLAYGRPVVSSSNGAAGLESFINNGIWVADEAEQFADHIISCLINSDVLVNSMQNSKNFIQSLNSVSLENLCNMLND
ncbi:MAG: glycosyltransferase [Balneolaceae bacterium]|nr:MAG: glycosyltransferase [Balneolaceae bacterium]